VICVSFPLAFDPLRCAIQFHPDRGLFIEKSANSGASELLPLDNSMCDQCMVNLMSFAVTTVRHADHFRWNQL
jgi:hypothetical protein